MMSTSRLLLTACSSILCLACGDGAPVEPGPPQATGSVAGRVTRASTGEPIVGAAVFAGDQSATTDGDGRYRVVNVPAGSVAILCEYPGLGTYQATVTVAAGNSATHDFGLSPAEIFEFAPYAIYVPLAVPAVRGVIVALGGPDTRSFITRGPTGAPESHSELLILGDDLRALAAELGLAVLGTSDRGGTSNTSPDGLVAAIGTLALRSARPEMRNAPVLTLGISAGGSPAWQFSQAQPARSIGVVLSKPALPTAVLTTPETGKIPTYALIGERDTVVSNRSTIDAFEANRAKGALWALANEPGIGHFLLTPTARTGMVEWIRAIVDLRLPAAPGGPLREIAEASGWLANPSTLDIAPWSSYAGEPSAAAWLPTRSTAERWQTLVRR